MSNPRIEWVVAVFLLLHAALALAVPLVEDEAYYALWATVPSWGYYDHPPMIAWWIAAGEWLFGVNRAGVRLLPVLSVASVTLMVWRMGWILSGGQRRAANLGALFYNATVLVLVLGFTATPDAPSLFFWALASWALVEALQGPRRGAWRWWLLAGLAAGLGVQSKFTNIFWGVGMVGWLVASRPGRQALRHAGPWLGAGAALLVIAPLVWWNAAHGWVGLERQFGRVVEPGLSARYLAEYLLVTPLLITPLIGWAAIAGAGRMLPPGRGALLWLTLPLPIYMIWHSLHSQVQANWLVPIFAGVAVAAGIGAAQRGARFARAAAGLGLAISALVLIVGFWPGRPLIGANTPFNQTRGWAETRAALSRIARDEAAKWIATDDYGTLAILSWYLPDLPVRDLTQPNRYLFRPPFPAALCGQKALMITARSGPFRPPFAQAAPPQEVMRSAGGRVLERFRVAAVQGLKAPPCATPAKAGDAPRG